MHTYWYARALAERGHEIHVVTNARDVEQNFRLVMTPEDWEACEGRFASGGTVIVHWTQLTAREALHVPQTSMALTRLAGSAVAVVQKFNIECIFSYYLEPYSIAGWIASQITSVPHVIKHAGSDIGRLAKVPLLRSIYLNALKSANVVVSRGPVRAELEREGIPRERFWTGDQFKIPAVFTPLGPKLSLNTLADATRANPDFRERTFGSLLPDGPVIGAYGKIGERKGTFSLLRSVALLKASGTEVSLAIVGSSFADREASLRQMIRDLAIEDRVLQLPFVPHWRVPEFVRACKCIMFLENRFPIKHHAPTIPREVLACGRALVCSEEVLLRQPFSRLLIDNVNCISVPDPDDIRGLAAKIAGALSDGERLKEIGAGGHEVSKKIEGQSRFPENYEEMFESVIGKRSSSRLTFYEEYKRSANVDAHDQMPDEALRRRLYRAPAEFALAVRNGSLQLNWIPMIEYGISWQNHSLSGIAHSGGGRFVLEISGGISDILTAVNGTQSIAQLCATLIAKRSGHTEQGVLRGLRMLFLEGLISFKHADKVDLDVGEVSS